MSTTPERDLALNRLSSETRSAMRAFGERVDALESQLAMRSNPGRGFTRAEGVDLKEHLEGKIEGLQEFFESRLVNLERNVGTATIAMDRRLDGMNELRGALKDAQTLAVTRDELAGQMRAVREEFALQLAPIRQTAEDAKRFMAMAQGKASQQSVMVAFVISIIGIGLSLVSLLLK